MIKSLTHWTSCCTAVTPLPCHQRNQSVLSKERRRLKTYGSCGSHGENRRVDGFEQSVAGNDAGSGEVVRVDVDDVLNNVRREVTDELLNAVEESSSQLRQGEKVGEKDDEHAVEDVLEVTETSTRVGEALVARLNTV